MVKLVREYIVLSSTITFVYKALLFWLASLRNRVDRKEGVGEEKATAPTAEEQQQQQKKRDSSKWTIVSFFQKVDCQIHCDAVVAKCLLITIWGSFASAELNSIWIEEFDNGNRGLSGANKTRWTFLVGAHTHTRSLPFSERRSHIWRVEKNKRTDTMRWWSWWKSRIYFDENGVSVP